ncbi:MAG: RHS repeat-associated core domain-containing protein [Bacteroidia bacterium]|nr:RHS repeat-associated core domain-containing protein [Bacteroidia bacterium]
MPEEMFIYDTDCTDEPLFDRGFTGHEHLYALGLINMNGRMYDPVTSSFLSPDNYVQCPTSQQGFNRYAYCFYNPLKYVDPTGERCYGPSEAEIVQRAINEARQRCWRETYRILEEQEAMYRQIKDGQHPFGWGLEPGGAGSENSSGSVVKWSYKSFDYGQLNKGVSSRRGKCVLTSLGSARKCWSEGRWGESTKEWEKREEEYYEQTGKHGYETGNFEDFIESNPDPSRYNTYVAMTGVTDISPDNICDLMDAGYVVAVFCTLENGEKHFANVESCTMYDDNSFTIKFSNPNPNMMPPLKILGANETYTISSDYYSTPRFIAYKLTIWKQ